MKSNNITAMELKGLLMAYYRYRRNSIVASEIYCGSGIADILSLDNKGKVTETEIKVSKQDLWRELKDKRYRHEYTLLNGIGRCPNKYYLCVPEYLKNEALIFVTRVNKKYGIIVYDGLLLSSKALKVIKRGSYLHKRDMSHIKNDIYKRLSAEVSNIYSERASKLYQERIEKITKRIKGE